MTVFKVGDKVKVKPNYPFNAECVLKSATVCDILDTDSIGLEFNFYQGFFHSCGGTCQDNRGWYIAAHYLELVKTEPLVIEGDDDEDCI